MGTKLTIETRIERLVVERRTLWHTGTNPARARAIGVELDVLWASLRTDRAHRVYGDRNVIITRARVERELDKTLSQ